MAPTRKQPARKADSTDASAEIRKEMRAVKTGKVKNEKQAIAIGLSKARRAGKEVPPPKKGTTTPAIRKKAQQDIAAGNQAKKAAVRPSGRKTATKKAGRKSATRKRRA